MKINYGQVEATFLFTPATHFLVYASRCGTEVKEWSLNPRIDRSEKGKDDDVGVAEIYIGEDDARKLKKAGFSYMEL